MKDWRNFIADFAIAAMTFFECPLIGMNNTGSRPMGSNVPIFSTLTSTTHELRLLRLATVNPSQWAANATLRESPQTVTFGDDISVLQLEHINSYILVSQLYLPSKSAHSSGNALKIILQSSFPHDTGNSHSTSGFQKS